MSVHHDYLTIIPAGPILPSASAPDLRRLRPSSGRWRTTITSSSSPQPPLHVRASRRSGQRRPTQPQLGLALLLLHLPPLLGLCLPLPGLCRLLLPALGFGLAATAAADHKAELHSAEGIRADLIYRRANTGAPQAWQSRSEDQGGPVPWAHSPRQPWPTLG